MFNNDEDISDPYAFQHYHSIEVIDKLLSICNGDQYMYMLYYSSVSCNDEKFFHILNKCFEGLNTTLMTKYFKDTLISNYRMGATPLILSNRENNLCTAKERFIMLVNKLYKFIDVNNLMNKLEIRNDGIYHLLNLECVAYILFKIDIFNVTQEELERMIKVCTITNYPIDKFIAMLNINSLFHSQTYRNLFKPKEFLDPRCRLLQDCV